MGVWVLGWLVPDLMCADSRARDGNWWLDHSREARTFYLAGFLDGMTLGADFEHWNLPGDAQFKAGKAYTEMVGKWMDGVPISQISDGLTTLYGDYRNRKIYITDGVWIVLNSIAGKSDKEMQSMIENYRQLAQ